jgi:hypothetical protein
MPTPYNAKKATTSVCVSIIASPSRFDRQRGRNQRHRQIASDRDEQAVKDRQRRRWISGHLQSTGKTSARPLAQTKLSANTPPDSAHAPTATTRFGVGMASWIFFSATRM